MGRRCAASLALALQPLTGLTHLNLSRSKITAQGIVALVPVFQNMSKLVTLDLNHTVIKGYSASALAPVLMSLTKLQLLDLSFNGLRSVATTAAFRQACHTIMNTGGTVAPGALSREYFRF